MTEMAGGGVVVWITGLPSCGKSTLAREVAASLRARGTPVVVLDGDEVRAAMVPSPGYDPAARDAFYETLARLAALLARQGLVAIVPATAARSAFRTRARGLAPRFVEVLVDVSLDECMRRDAKGLYAQPLAELPGAGTPYEAPIHPEVIARNTPGDVALVLSAVDATSPRASASDE